MISSSAATESHTVPDTVFPLTKYTTDEAANTAARMKQLLLFVRLSFKHSTSRSFCQMSISTSTGQ